MTWVSLGRGPALVYPPGRVPTTTPAQPRPITEERGDASCYGFWERGRNCIFDIRITDTESRSNRNKDIDKVLARHENEKKDKYLHNCHEQRKNFTPMIYSVGGIAGREARSGGFVILTGPRKYRSLNVYGFKW